MNISPYYAEVIIRRTLNNGHYIYPFKPNKGYLVQDPIKTVHTSYDNFDVELITNYASLLDNTNYLGTNTITKYAGTSIINRDIYLYSFTKINDKVEAIITMIAHGAHYIFDCHENKIIYNKHYDYHI